MTGSSQPEHEVISGEVLPEPIRQTPPNFSQQLGKLIRRSATGMAIGVIGTGMFTEYDNRSEARALSDVPVAPLTIYTPLPKQNPVSEAKDTAAEKKSSGDTHEDLKSKDCTSLRRRANDIYMGLACAENGAKADTVYSSTMEKGWVYSAVYVGGIYKCAYVKAGVLPEMQHRPKIIEKCRGFFNALVNKRYEFFNEYNCGELRPGLEGCRSGTPPRGKSEECKDVDTLDGNYATDEPTPFNVLGTGEGGFSMTLPNEINAALSYRVEVKQGSAEGKAIVVRDTNNTPTLDWGFAHTNCIDDSDRKGGTPTER